MQGRWWKLVGLAGVAGVAATGAVVARAERQRRAYTPDEVRAKLHDRFAGSADTAGTAHTAGTDTDSDPDLGGAITPPR